jgi:hypothetical protein
MIKHTVERRDVETVEIWLQDDAPDTEEVNSKLDLQLNGINWAPGGDAPQETPGSETWAMIENVVVQT